MKKSLKDKFLDTIDKYGMLNNGDSVLIALSGGIDSTVMTCLFNEIREEFNLTLYAFHLNHKLRAKEAEREAVFVKKLCAKLKIKAFIKEYDIRGYANEKKLPIQLAGREIRYKLIDEVRVKHNINKVATAHNADDRAETVLIRLLRGTAGANIAGIPAVRDGYIIRPLIENFRAEILDYAEKNKVEYVTDSSNLKTDYLRNKVRLELIPHLTKEFNSKILRSLFNFSTIATIENDYINENVKVKYEDALVKEEHGFISFSAKILKETEQALLNRIFLAAYYKLTTVGHTLTYKHIEKLNQILRNDKPNLSYKLPGGIFFNKNYDNISFSLGEVSAFSDYDYEHKLNDSTYIKETGLTVKSELIKSDNIADLIKRKKNNEEYISAERVTYPITIRNFRNGDTIRPLNMNGTKKLKDIFINKKIPIKTRCTVAVLTSGGEIILVNGVCLSDNFKVTDKTRKVLKIETLI